MEERRKGKRIESKSKLLVRRPDLGGREEVGVEVVKVSRTDIGFYCDRLLEMGAVYEARLTIWAQEVIHAFIEIVRIEKFVDTFEYGGLFIGVPEISVYGTDGHDAENGAQAPVKETG